jgi:paraquat-inducible protein B
MSTTPQATLHQKKGLPLHWFIPLIAAALTGFLIFNHMGKRGTVISITFDDASGVIAGKTELRCNGVKVGLVEKVALSSDIETVQVEALLSPDASGLAREGTSFWIVRPSLNLAGVSGVETLISGNYIEMIVGKGESTKKFKGLSARPPADPNSPDLNLFLICRTLPNVSVGSSVLFRGVKVGQVTDCRFDQDNLKAIVEIRIEEKFKKLIRKDSRFWDSSGLNLSLDLKGGTVKTDGLLTGIFGSISLNTTDGLMKSSPPAKWGDKFALYPNFEELIKRDEALVQQIIKEDNQITHPVLLHIGDASGLTANQTQIRCRGVAIGKIVSYDINPGTLAVTAYALVDARWKDLMRTDSRIIFVRPEIEIHGLQRIKLGGALEGSYLEVLPGTKGQLSREFTVQSYSRETFRPMNGLHITLVAQRAGKLEPGSPILYRGIPVGQIESLTLSDNSTGVEMGAVIESRYAPLIHAHTRFWNASGFDISFGLIKGLKVSSESVDSILTGSIAFATPNNPDMGTPAKRGDSFTVSPEAEPGWYKWQPVIELPDR